MARDLNALFSPSSVAVYGASVEKGSMGNRAVANLVKGNFGGEIIPINPKYAGKLIEGKRCYASAADYGAPIDHAILMIRATSVVPLIEDAISGRVRSIAIQSGGFAEIGSAGRVIQDKVLELVRSAGITLLGPNCLGFVNAAGRVYASPGSVFEAVWPQGGPMAFISQSGAVAANLLAAASDVDLDTSFWVSTGNECDVSVADCIGFASRLDKVQVIALYIESIKDVGEFRRAVKQARSRGKNVVAIRPGRTSAGASAVQSHTAALVTSDSLYDALFRQLGIIRVDSQRDLIDVVRACVLVGRRPRGLVIATSSGGNGAITADAAAAAGLRLATISAAGQRKLLGLISSCSPRNPIDITGATNNTPEILDPFLSVVLEEKDVDCMMMIHASGMLWLDRAYKISATLIDLARKYAPKRILFIGPVPADVRPKMNEVGIAVFDDSVALVKAISLLEGPVGFSGLAARQPTGSLAGKSDRVALDEDQAMDVVEDLCGIPAVKRRVATSIAELNRAVKVLKLPIVLKAVLPGVTHKTELGAVRVGLKSITDIRRAWDDLDRLCRARKVPTRILVEAMVDRVVSEVLLSAFVDPLLGPFVTVGAGGTNAEAMDDVVVIPAPASRKEAGSAIRRLRSQKHLLNSRAGLSGNEGELIEAIVNLSKAIARHSTDARGRHIVEIEINPFMLRTTKSCAADAVVTVVGP